MVTDWVRIGSRFINLSNVIEVRASERPAIVQIVFIGGGSIELRDDEAQQLHSLLDGQALRLESAHRRVIGPAA
ncbi:MAG TPA: hypothetical protein VFN57_03720 [Thermomicrobiaceae bacterium]|nr:hypothetical protein [Thermomicrobiaceae bacterium]